MKSNSAIKLIISTLIALFLLPLAGLGKSVECSLLPGPPIKVGDRFYINIRVTDIQGRPELNRSTSIPGAKLLYFTDTGSGVSSASVNGRNVKSSFYTEYTLTLQAVSKGRHTFGPISVGGVKSNKVSFTIGGESGSSENTRTASTSSHSGNPRFIGTGNGNLFLKANVSKTNVYEQEAIVYTVKLYSSYSNIRFVGATSAPKFEGFVVEESKDISHNLTFESYQGKQYATAVIARYIIFPQMTGNLKVTGNTYTVSVDEREYYRDQYWGTMSVSRPMQINVKPGDLNINVRPLPTPRPANFSGGVGKFSITAKLPSSKLKTNQAAQVIYTVSGSGNLKYIKLPELNSLFPKELEVFSPDIKTNASVSGNTVSGNSIFDYSFMPMETGHYKIPSVELIYFNPATGRYETSSCRGFDVEVSQGEKSSKSQTNTVFKFNPKLMEIGEVSKQHPFFIENFLNWLWYVIPPIILVFLIIWYRQIEKQNSDIIGLKSRKANSVAVKRLRKAHKYMDSDNPSVFYEIILSSLWGYVSDKLKVPTSELNRENILAKFKASEVPEDICNKFISLIDECEFVRYAPEGGKSAVKSIYIEALDTIGKLETFFKKQRK